MKVQRKRKMGLSPSQSLEAAIGHIKKAKEGYGWWSRHRRDTIVNGLIELIDENIIGIERAAKILGVSEPWFMELMKK